MIIISVMMMIAMMVMKITMITMMITTAVLMMVVLNVNYLFALDAGAVNSDFERGKWSKGARGYYWARPSVAVNVP